jgi:hypothetical protein
LIYIAFISRKFPAADHMMTQQVAHNILFTSQQFPAADRMISCRFLMLFFNTVSFSPQSFPARIA